MTLPPDVPLPGDTTAAPNTLAQPSDYVPPELIAATRLQTPAEARAVLAAVAAQNARFDVPGYEILGELGRGGMGVVYRARQQTPNRLVALKVVLAGAHTGSNEHERFLGEAEAIARLRHPNIVQVYHVGKTAGQPFFSLEYCDGGTLRQKLAGR